MKSAKSEIQQLITHPSRKLQQELTKKLPFDKIFKWVNSNYTEHMKPLKYKTDYDTGCIKRMFSLQTLKYGFLDNTIKSHIVVFKLNDGNLRKEINYATIFATHKDDLTDEILDGMFSYERPIIGDFVMMYCATGGSFMSCDGEYRNKLIRYLDFKNAKNEHNQLWEELEEYVLNFKAARNWNLYTTYYNEGDRPGLGIVIKSELLDHSMFVLAWFNTVYAEFMGTIETHINPTFKDVLLQHYTIDKKFLDNLSAKYDLLSFYESMTMVHHPVFGSKYIRHISTGFKMIPLNLREVQRPYDIKYKPWREYFISLLASDLVPNQIAPGFPILCNHLYIKNSKKGLYDNKTQYDKLRNSEIAKDILHTLHDAQSGTYLLSSIDKQWINTKFQKLSEKIDDPINYLSDEIIMSDVSLFIISENVGRTFGDIMINEQLIKRLESYDTFAKYLFEVCYNLLAINKLGVIHGDLHLNNATIGQLYRDASGFVLYDAGAEYAFENDGYFASIIDFSRSIINPEEYPTLVKTFVPNAGLPFTHKLTEQPEHLVKSEMLNLLNLYIMLMPNKERQREELTALFKKRPSDVFKILTCIDLFMFGIRLNKMLIQAGLSKKHIDLNEKIISLSETYITKDLNDLYTSTSDLAWPIQTIINKCFSEFEASKRKITFISDFYSLEHPKLYSLLNYDQFPECMRSIKYEEKNKLITVEGPSTTRQHMRKSFEALLRSNYDLIKVNSLKSQ